MPAKSPEALARKAHRRAQRRVAAKRAEMAPKQDLKLSSHKITARRMMPRLPDDISKADLRNMLAQAMRNTAT